jgi:hypothetical protein
MEDEVVYLTSVSREESLKQIRDFFFRAMLQGYAEQDGGKIQKFPRCSQFVWQEGNLSIIDTWYVSPGSDKSAGHTVIFLEDVPVWFMSYGGQYQESAIPLLKQALKQAYQERRFLGGRGISRAEGTDLYYINVPRVNDFAKFCGREEITNRNKNLLGFHEYWGMALI